MDSFSELDWAEALHGLLLEREPKVDEMYRQRRFSPLPCPQCAEYKMVRRPLQPYLRPLRRLGVDVRHYFCEACHRDSVLKHRQ